MTENLVLNNESNETKPLVSIILPVYNTFAPLIDRCCRSLTSQSYENIEILFVDDGSAQECASYLDERAKSDSRIKVIHKPNGGVSSARNCGIDKVKGDFIFFVDPDDELANDKVVESAVGHAVSEQADIVFATLAYCFQEKSFPTSLWGDAFDDGALAFEQSSASAFRDYFFSYKGSKKIDLRFFPRGPVVKLYRKAVIGELRFNENMPTAEDGVFNSRVFSKADKIVAVNSVWYNYYQYKKSAVHSDSKDMLSRVQANCEAAKTDAAEVSENVYLSFCDSIIQWGACEILRSGGPGSFKQAIKLLSSDFSKEVYEKLDLSEFELSSADKTLESFLKEGHYGLYCLAIKFGLMMMPLRGKKLIG